MGKKGIYILEVLKKKGPLSIILEQLRSSLKAFEIKSIKKKMILVFLILALIPLLAMRLVVYPKAQDALQTSLIQNLHSVGHKQAELIKGWTEERKGDVRVIAENPFTLLASRIDTNDKRFWRLLRYTHYIRYEYDYKEVLISDAAGIIHVSTQKGRIGADISGQEYFKKAMDGETFASQIFPSKELVENRFGRMETGVPTMVVATPITDQNKIMGVACLRVDVEKISELMRSIKLGASGETYLVNKQGYMITESRFASDLRNQGLIEGDTTLQIKLINPETGKLTKSVSECLKGRTGSDGKGYVDYRGVKVIGFWQWIPELDWGVIAEIDYDEGYIEVDRLRKRVNTIMIIVSLGVVVLAVFMGQRMVAPILYLTDATRKMNAGDLTQEVNIHTKDEIGELAVSFNMMTRTLKKRNEELQSSNIFMESMFDAIRDPMTVLDKDGTIKQVNKVAMDTYGENIVGEKCYCVYKGRESICDNCPTMKSIETLLPATAEHYVERDKKYVFIASYPILNKEGKLESIIKMVRDITEQKKLEKELQEYTANLEKIVEERTRDLKSTNEELKQRSVEIEKANEELRSLDKMKDVMIRDVTHELKSPVAQVQMAIDLWTSEAAKEKVDKEKGKKLSKIIDDNIQRLKKTIQSILDLSVLESGRVAYQKENLNLEEIVHQTEEGLKLIAEKKGLILTTRIPDKLPEVFGDRTEITRVVSNLIDNAIKYSETGEIIVSALRRAEDIEITVKDQGIGLITPKENFDKLFSRFYQERASADGSGVGLAICKKIVKAHGGKIWVESEGKGKGTTFKFTLPVISDEQKASDTPA
ncbi:Alginate biosynthesis sensor protein KinB [Candidatus Brocadiaceae bacterium S225]|uniref:histidine kinase n=1 Tax=Candidatus Scalindua brodae TaxID=237368 RepID=A0A0B0EH57_9BACT|nr:MAG: two-component sensor kinase [Candidatus Scalindua brodae]TWU34681.1 Alginate biosynthesis sensor protein KinB [Candidatus Brocadiaceae bacterium S225]